MKLNGLVLFSLLRQMPTVKAMRDRSAHHRYESARRRKSLIYVVSESGIYELPRDVERMTTPSKEVAFWAYELLHS